MRKVGVLALLVFAAVACGPKEPSDADQQQLAKDFSPENVAREYEKKGMMKEAEEVRRNAKSGEQGGGQ